MSLFLSSLRRHLRQRAVRAWLRPAQPSLLELLARLAALLEGNGDLAVERVEVQVLAQQTSGLLRGGLEGLSLDEGLDAVLLLGGLERLAALMACSDTDRDQERAAVQSCCASLRALALPTRR